MAEPLDNQFGLDIIDGKIGPRSTLDKKTTVRTLVTDYKMTKTDANKIWDWGPLGCGPNIIVDTTKGVQYLLDIKDSFTSAF